MNEKTIMAIKRQPIREVLFMLVAVFMTAAGLLALCTPAAQARPALGQPLAVAYPVPTPVAPDPFEQDNACADAKFIVVDSMQFHNFHDDTEVDWLRFESEANKTYIVEGRKLGAIANPVIALQDSCGDPP